MSDPDDLPLGSPPAATASVEAPQATKAGPMAMVAIIGLALGAAGAWWWARQARPPAAPVAATQGTDAVVPPDSAPVRPLPPVDQMDTFLRALLGTLSSSPELAWWLTTDDLIRQMANGIDRIANGASPASELAGLKPKSGFAVTERRKTISIDPASYRRYDSLAALVSSLDARAVADAYQTIRPRLDEAYRQLGRSEAGIDTAVAAALQRLIDTPQPEEPIRLAHGAGASYVFADASLERLSPIQKQLIRMGPENLRRIRTRLTEIKQAIEALPAP
jgi:Protein of unknown function (DUF3014)